MINNVSLTGRLTKDPELRYTPAGVAVAQFTLAVNRPFANQEGEREADFINIVVWRKPGENAANFLKKGSLAGVEGRIQTRHYDNDEGRRVYVTEVVANMVHYLDSKSSNDGNQGQGQNQGQSQNQSQKQSQNKNQGGYTDPFQNEGRPIDISDDDLPF